MTSRRISRKIKPLLTLLAVAGLTVCAERALLAGSPGSASAGLWLIGLLFALLFLVTLRRLKFDAWLTGILVCATALYLTYATYTDITERNYDGPDHFFYAHFIAEHGQLPPTNACTVFGWAVALSGLAVFTKANAYALVFLMLLAVTWRYIREGFTRIRARQVAVAWAVAVSCGVLAVASRARQFEAARTLAYAV